MDQTIKDSVAWLKDLAHPGAHLRLDSREVKPGDIFCAVPGEKVDGRTFIRVAAARGAAGVIYEAETSQRPEHYPLPAKPVEHLRERLGEIAARFYDEPSAHMTGVAVTGTNGKTTTTFWTASLLTALGSPSGIIGTVGVFFAGRQIPAPHLTTPDAASLQGILKDLEETGAKSFVMEASSVGLDQGRMKGTHFKVGVFTNLSRDHLDYHQTMEAYGEAKGLLFAWPGLKAAVLNASDAWSRKYADAAQKNGSEIWVTGLEGEAASFGQAFGAAHVLEAKQIEPSHRGMRFTLVCDKREFPVELHALGTFNVDNALEAAAAAAGLAAIPSKKSCGLWKPSLRLQAACRFLSPMECRSELWISATRRMRWKRPLSASFPMQRARGGRLWTVFGCGGDRDAGKRPIMGEIAARLSDQVIVTSDNPRTENPQAIVDAIMQGVQAVPGADQRTMAVVDRREAIHRAVFAADAKDIILVAGKGHECEQILNDGPHHFVDGEVLREAFNECRAVRSRK